MLSPEASSTVGAKYGGPSAKTALKPGEKIDNLFRNMKQPHVLQRLTQRSYYFQRLFYSTMAHFTRCDPDYGRGVAGASNGG